MGKKSNKEAAENAIVSTDTHNTPDIIADVPSNVPTDVPANVHADVPSNETSDVPTTPRQWTSEEYFEHYIQMAIEVLEKTKCYRQHRKYLYELRNIYSSITK